VSALRGWHIGTIGGIDIEVNSSWLVIFALFVMDLGRDVFARLAPEGYEWMAWAAAVATTLLFFGSVLLHELSHSFMARAHGIAVSRITLFVFGGVAQVEEEPKKATDELLIALAGPLMSVLLALVFFGLWWGARQLQMPPIFCAVFSRVSATNLALAIFNMIPGFPLDGGRVLRSLLWYHWNDLLRATRLASLFGQAVGYGITALGVFLGLTSGSLILAIFYAGMGMLLVGVARTAYRREQVKDLFSRLTVGDVAGPPELTFHVGTPLEVAASHLSSRSPQGPVPILYGGQPVGILALERLGSIPRWQWPVVPVEEVMEPLREEMVIRHSRTPQDAVDKMAQFGRRDLLVLDDWGYLQGVVNVERLQAAAEGV
jgi:Zn-dependent protease